MEPVSDIVVQELVDGEIGVVKGKGEKVFEESSSDGVVSFAAVSELKNGTVTTEPSCDVRVSGDEGTIVKENVEKVMYESRLDAVVSNSDIALSNGVKVGTDSLLSETGNLLMEPVSDNGGGGGIAAQDSVDDARVFENEKEIVVEKVEKVLDESSSDAVVSSIPPSNSDLATSNEVEVRADLLKSNTESQTGVLSNDHERGVGVVVHGSRNDVRVSGDEQEIVLKDAEKDLDENEVNDKEKEGQYKVTDLVWAKVKNYPWWPGQIFDPSASTDKAKKFSNKKGFLIAYFGDQSFAWIKASNIKPFRKNFHKMEKQGKSKAFNHAVNCALDEVSRRVDFGLACSCLSKEVYNNIKTQVFVNAGIKKEASEIEGGDNFSSVCTFKPVNIVQSVQDLAREHFDGIGRLEVLSVRTQILAYFRWKGYNQFSTQFLGGLDAKLEDNSELPLMEEDKGVEDAKPASVSAKVSSKKRKLNARDTGDLVLNDKSEDDSELSLMDEDKVVEDEKPISVGAKVSSKKKKLNGDSGDSVPRKKEKGLTNVILKGKSLVKSKSKKNSGDLALNDKLEDKSELPLMEDDKVAEDAKPTSVSAKVSSKRKKLNASDSDDSAPRKKEKGLKNVTQKENSSVKSKSKKNSEKKVTLADSGFKKESRNTTDDRKLPISPPKKMFRIGDTICRIAKQLSESPSILQKDSKKSKTDEKNVEQTDPPSTFKKKSKKSKNDEKRVEKTESPSILKKDSKKSQNDEKRVEKTESPPILKKYSKKSKSDKKFVEQTESPSIHKKETNKSKNDEKCIEQMESASILKEDPEKSKDDEKCVEQSKENSKTSKENTATALILKFTNVDSIPSLTKLNEIFSRYGTVREADTEIMQKNNCAKVVFDEQSDAETAFSSAGKFSVFGPSLISYRLDYSPTLKKTYSRNKKRNRKDRKSVEANQSEDEAA